MANHWLTSSNGHVVARVVWWAGKSVAGGGVQIQERSNTMLCRLPVSCDIAGVTHVRAEEGMRRAGMLPLRKHSGKRQRLFCRQARVLRHQQANRIRSPRFAGTRIVAKANQRYKVGNFVVTMPVSSPVSDTTQLLCACRGRANGPGQAGVMGEGGRAVGVCV